MAVMRVDYADGVDTIHGADINTWNTQINSNTTSITTAQYVPFNPQTTSYTLVLGDAGKAVLVNAGTGTNVTVPPSSSVAYPVGTVIQVAQMGTGQVTLVPGSGVTLNTANTLKTRARYSELGIMNIATDVWLVGGDSG